MKYTHDSYSFNVTNGVLTLIGLEIRFEQLLMIVNATRNVIYYNFADPATRISNFQLTQDDTIVTINNNIRNKAMADGHQNSDSFIIYYEDKSSYGGPGVLNYSFADTGYGYLELKDANQTPLYLTANKVDFVFTASSNHPDVNLRNPPPPATINSSSIPLKDHLEK